MTFPASTTVDGLLSFLPGSTLVHYRKTACSSPPRSPISGVRMRPRAPRMPYSLLDFTATLNSVLEFHLNVLHTGLTELPLCH